MAGRPGRKSKLSEEQWREIIRRANSGEPNRELAREFDVNESVIRRKLKCVNLPELAEEKAAAQLTAANIERKIAALPESHQVIVNNMAAKLVAISASMASAAEYSAQTSAILAGIARKQAEKICPVDPFGPDSVKAVTDTVNMTKAANLAGELPASLLQANRATVDRINNPEDAEPDKSELLAEIVKHLPD